MITVGSICTGYGGLELGLQHASIDHQTLWHSETCPNATTVLNHHWPDTPNIGDIKKANPHDLEQVELITAGFPCQDISVAGQQQGIGPDPGIGKSRTTDSTRSGLWWTIRDTISVLRPQYVFLENVSAILTGPGPTVIGSLTQIGYDSRWAVVRASEVGAPHQRKRWFCLATDTQDNGHQRPRHSWNRRPGLADSNRPATHTNSEGPQGPQPAPRQNLSHRGTFGDYTPAVNRWEQLTRPAPQPAVNGRLNPVFVEWMMGLPDGWVTSQLTKQTAALQVLGNGVVPQQAAQAIRAIRPQTK